MWILVLMQKSMKLFILHIENDANTFITFDKDLFGLSFDEYLSIFYISLIDCLNEHNDITIHDDRIICDIFTIIKRIISII